MEASKDLVEVGEDTVASGELEHQKAAHTALEALGTRLLPEEAAVTVDPVVPMLLVALVEAVDTVEVVDLEVVPDTEDLEGPEEVVRQKWGHLMVDLEGEAVLVAWPDLVDLAVEEATRQTVETAEAEDAAVMEELEVTDTMEILVILVMEILEVMEEQEATAALADLAVEEDTLEKEGTEALVVMEEQAEQEEKVDIILATTVRMLKVGPLEVMDLPVVMGLMAETLLVMEAVEAVEETAVILA